MYTECTVGTDYNVSWQKLINSYTELKWGVPKALTHANNIERKHCLSSWIVFSKSSKERALRSFHITHIRQCGIRPHIEAALHLRVRPDQQAKRSTTCLGITHQTPNNEKINAHSSLAVWEWRKRWSMDSLASLHMQHQSIITNWRFQRLSIVNTFPKEAVHMKKFTLEGTRGFHTEFQG